MNHLLQYKTKQFFFVLIKVSIVVGAFYFIFSRLTSNTNLNFSDFISVVKQNNALSLKSVFILTLLTSFNWGFEILKWQLLVSTFKKISFKEALEQSLGSLTASIFTPNRIGEYGAKAIYFVTDYRKKVLLVNFLGNVTQMLVTTVFGLIGLSVLLINYELPVNYYNISIVAVSVLILALIIIILTKKTNFSIKGFSIEKLKRFVINFPKRILSLVLGLSILRYLVFSFQFHLLLLFFNIELSYFTAMVFITSMYLLSSIIPSIFIFDVVVKGSVSLYLFSLLHINAFTILSVTTLMWFFNFVLPSVFGSYYVLNFNLPKKTV
ncbi:lysylphosphatidylglycerol synthase domain-containing protein [Seonamhaeicola marinus]|uniref:Flippase-like domain-containing protein n=1 Tax=Seonamhaeicola marinus TaxID=1912246 RepID=A0A5D0HF99_9FLAO|nr:lysylphosphatidylglycerol synthase domain-containing protein [Seonamhaeicola marinus]TYA69961.1 hypothetical protein FUA24_21970 [Seonamhaeicola marinus]